MAKTKTYSHFCPVARSLEVIGEKWSLLIVRDLLRGPQRFTDLYRYLGGITPKWLTLRLRDLEQAGIVERDHTEGRREVWYRLTDKGRELAPVVQSLAVWGIDHALRPPLPGEPVHAERAMQTMTTFRNRRGIRLPAPAVWLLRFAGEGTYAVRYDGEHWSYERGETAHDVLIETTPEAWVNLLLADRADRPRLAAGIAVSGDPDQVDALYRSLGIPSSVPAVGRTAPSPVDRDGRVDRADNDQPGVPRGARDDKSSSGYPAAAVRRADAAQLCGGRSSTPSS